jgi:hypothetical protein
MGQDWPEREDTMSTKKRALREFIRQNRAEIDAHIRGVCPNVGRLNDDERETWILNDEPLYLWAQSSGVAV